MGRVSQAGTTMIEVLVTVVIIAIGLLALGALQLRLQASEVETYQRAQATLLVADIAQRLQTNRHEAPDYVTGASTPTGTGTTCPVIAGNATRAQRDLSAWCHALQGSAESLGNARSGAMIGARGCVETLAANEYRVTVAWQGLTALSAPPAGVTCAANLYDGGASSPCTNDRCRRTASLLVRIASLD